MSDVKRPSSTTTFRDGDVVDYTPRNNERHCREWMAVVKMGRDGRLIMLDTFWGSHDRYPLTPDEQATATVRFHLHDYRQVPAWEWEQYAPADRQTITSQHGLQVQSYVRNEASPDLPTIIQNARDRLERAKERVRSAEWAVADAERDLARILQEAEGIEKGSDHA